MLRYKTFLHSVQKTFVSFLHLYKFITDKIIDKLYAIWYFLN